ncbi:MAG TPA: riboflavin synthase [Vicinamibacterales bacterium]|jgi:riboflavin synthase|nr:riboflavin synthase [Vicinamibacterales bacterium]
MFTGLIEAVATVARLDPLASGYRLRLETPLAPELQLGESVAVDGVCLTVTSRDAGGWDADIGPETARVTTLGSFRPGRRVNLERSMRADSRFGGHLVQGHVDATGEVLAIRPDGESHWIDVAFPEPLSPLFVAKGSVAVNGVSLTVATLETARFSVMIIPFTWEHTSLSALQRGARVNLECDMVGKYVARAAEWYRRP